MPPTGPACVRVCMRIVKQRLAWWGVSGVVVVVLRSFSKCQLNYRQFERNYFNCVNHFAPEPKCNKAAAFRAPLVGMPMCVRVCV